MDLLKISNYIDDFFEKRNGELKFSRKLVNKEYAKKIGIALLIIVTIIINILGEVLSNLGFGQKPNLILGIFIPKLTFLPIYIIAYAFIGYVYIRIILNIKASFKEIDEGQKGTSRFATRKEIESQYKAVPIADKLYEGNGGIPIAKGKKIYQNSKGENVEEEVMFIDDSSVNNLIIGTTRSGKGETYVVPTIDIYSRADKKPSLIINDPKGELMAMCQGILENRGYDVYMLNLLQPINSMSYNPLELIKQAYKKGDYSEAQLLCKTLTHSLYFKPNVKDPFWQNSAMSLVNALILAVCDECISRGEEEKITMYTVANMLSELGGSNVPNKNGDGEVNKLDEYFKSLPSNSVAKSQYATSSFAGGSARGNIFSVAMSELQTYTLEETGKLTSKNSLNFEEIGFFSTFKCKVTVKDKLEDEDINNIYRIENIDMSKENKNVVFGIRDISIERENNNSINYTENKINNYRVQNTLSSEREEIKDYEDNLYYQKMEEKKKLKSIIEIRRKELKELLLQNVRAFNVEGKEVTSKITIDMSEVNFTENGDYEVEYKIPLDRPKAIFMVTPDYDKSNHVLSSIFVRQIYYVLAKKSSLNDTSKCDREVIFLLDEFGNMPPIEGFANIITVCLGRGIRFNMIIQAYSQLKNLYGEDASTIEGNCGNQIYIMTNDNDTAEKFSKLLGEQTIITNSRSGEVFSLNKSQTESLDARRLLKADELTKLKEGETAIVRVIKRRDNKNEKIISYPILNCGEHAMKYRYEYLYDLFDNKENVFKNVKVKSLHKDVKLDDLIIDFSKTNKEVKQEMLKKYDEEIREINNEKLNRNCDIETNTYNDRTSNNVLDSKILKAEAKNKFCINNNKRLMEKEKNHIKSLNTKEELIEYLEDINKHDLLSSIDLYFN